MSKYPRTDAARLKDVCRHMAMAEECTRMEYELNEAKARIKRMEEAGDRLSDCADQIGWTSCESPQWIKKAENAVKEWNKAKEAKP